MSPLRDSLTGLDGSTIAVAKLVGVAFGFVFLGLSIASFVLQRPFDMLAFGGGAGSVVAAMGLAIKLTETSEPKPHEPKPPEDKP